MCGIAGFYAWGERRPPVNLLKALFVTQQTRGQSAAGLAFLAPDSTDQIITIKQKGPAEQLVMKLPQRTWQAIAASPRALFHARATTKGSESNNENNHPVDGLGWHVVHNGMVSNDDDLWLEDKTKARFAEVDTSAINLVLAQGDPKDLMSSLAGLARLGGSVTAAAWSTHHPDHMVLVRLGYNDLWLFLDDDILYWSSSDAAGRIMPGIDIGSTRFLPVSRMMDDRILVLSPGERGGETLVVNRRPFSIARSSGHTSTTPQSGVGANRGSRWDHQLMALSWTSGNQLDLPNKPQPAAINAGKFSWNASDLILLRNKLMTAKDGDQEIVETSYGRWTLTRITTDRIVRVRTTFKPHRRVKKFWKVWPNRQSVILPALIKDGVTEYDNLLHVDTVKATMRLSVATDSRWEEEGFSCPWCGAWARKYEVLRRKMICEFCNIKSKPPRKEEKVS